MFEEERKSLEEQLSGLSKLVEEQLEVSKRVEGEVSGLSKRVGEIETSVSELVKGNPSPEAVAKSELPNYRNYTQREMDRKFKTAEADNEVLDVLVEVARLLDPEDPKDKVVIQRMVKSAETVPEEKGALIAQLVTEFGAASTQ